MDVGFAGAYRAGSWTPVVVSPADPATAGVGDTIHVWAEDADGQFVRSPPATLEARDGERLAAARVRLRVGRPTGRVRVEHTRGSQGTTSEQPLPQPLPATHRVLLVLGDVPAARRAVRLIGADGGRKMHAVEITDAEARTQLAAGAWARDYDGADAAIVCGRDINTLPTETVAGLDAWVRDGGRLVFAAGASAQDVEQGRGPAAAWLPGSVERLVPLRRLAAIEAYARGSGLAVRAAQTPPLVPLFAERKRLAGIVDAFDGAAATDLPLVVRRPHGFGTITWLGIDLDAEPFRSWPGADSLVVRLLGERATDGAENQAVETTGTPDLASQLRVAIESSGVAGRIAPVPFEAIMGLGLLYVACLYPLDWWLVSRGRRRPWLAWITLPLIIAAFTGGAAALARGWQPREPLACRAAEIIDVDVASGSVRGSAWAATWRNDNGVVDVAVPAATGSTSPRRESAAVSWWADAGTGFGAIDAALPHPSLAARDYAYGDSLGGLVGVPVAAAADRLFEATWSASMGKAAAVTATLARDAQGALEGTLTHHLPFPLEGCKLAYAGWLYDIGRLAPGEAHDLGQGRGPRSLAGALARRESVREREVAPRWNPAETDVARILEIAGFHAAAGGSGYTGLPAGRLARLDLSPLLAVDRAVLFGAVGTAEPEWSAGWIVKDGQGRPASEVPESTAARLCRIVIPLAEGAASR